MEEINTKGKMNSVKKRNSIDIVLLIIKCVLVAVLIAALLDFSNKFTATWWSDIQNKGNPSYCGGSGSMVLLCGLFLAIVNLCVFVIGFLAFLFTLFNKHCKETGKHRKHFIWLMVAPFANQLVFFLFCRILFMIGMP